MTPIRVVGGINRTVTTFLRMETCRRVVIESALTTPISFDNESGSSTKDGQSRSKRLRIEFRNMRGPRQPMVGQLAIAEL
jgi:hypothetical protein